MKKNFVLDTNVLLHDPSAIHGFEDNVVNIPIYVVEEIDQFKRDVTELGRNARQVSRELDKYREMGSLTEGLSLPNGGTIRVIFTQEKVPPEFSISHVMDNSILAVALHVMKTEPDMQTIFVSKDSNLRIRANALGIHAEDYDKEGIDVSEIYAGNSEMLVNAAEVDRFFESGSLPIPEDGLQRYPNEYVTLRDRDNPNRTGLGRLMPDRGLVVPLARSKDAVWGIRAKNREQHFALDALLNDEIRLVTISGKAGTGKTLIAIAAGLQKTTEEEVYTKLLVSRPIFPLGKDLGYLPGTVEEKLNPWMQPIHDNIEFLLGLSRGDKRSGRSYHELVDLGILEVEPLTYIRGRSIPNQFMIVDEAQNLTPHEVKTIVSRAGNGTKIVFTGDPYQIDQPYLDSVNNGLTYLVEKFKGEKLAAHMTLVKGERSELAELAANLL